VTTALLVVTVFIFVIVTLVSWLLTPQEKPPRAKIHLEGP